MSPRSYSSTNALSTAFDLHSVTPYRATRVSSWFTQEATKGRDAPRVVERKVRLVLRDDRADVVDLVHDPPAVLLVPLPDLVHERVATEVVLGHAALFLELALYDALRSHTRARTR